MPYIKKDLRPEREKDVKAQKGSFLDVQLKNIIEFWYEKELSNGELSFMLVNAIMESNKKDCYDDFVYIFMCLDRVLDSVMFIGGWVNGMRLKSIIELTKKEIYRRLIAPYEDKKIEINGDVF